MVQCYDLQAVVKVAVRSRGEELKTRRRRRRERDAISVERMVNGEKVFPFPTRIGESGSVVSSSGGVWAEQKRIWWIVFCYTTLLIKEKSYVFIDNNFDTNEPKILRIT